LTLIKTSKVIPNTAFFLNQKQLFRPVFGLHNLQVDIHILRMRISTHLYQNGWSLLPMKVVLSLKFM